VFVKYKVNDILLYNCQGVITSGIITKIVIIADGIIYDMDSGDAIREDIVISYLGNAEVISEDFYDKSENVIS